MESNHNPMNEGKFPEYKGAYYNNEADEETFYEFGAHFPYKGLYNRLEKLKQEQDNEIPQPIPSILFNNNQLGKRSFIQATNKKESRNKNPVAPFKTAVGIHIDKNTKDRNQSSNQKTSLLADVANINMFEKLKKINQGFNVKNMTFKHFIRPTNTVANNNINNNNELNSKTRNTMQSIKLVKDYTLQDITGTIKQKSRNRSRNNKELENRLLFSQGQGGGVLQHSLNEVGIGNGSNTSKGNNNTNNNKTNSNSHNNYGGTIINKKSRNTIKGQLCLSNTHTTNENKSGGTNKTNKTVQTMTNNNNNNIRKTDSFGKQKNYKSLNDKGSVNNNNNNNNNNDKKKKHTHPKVVGISNLKATAKTVISTNIKGSYHSNNTNNNGNTTNTNQNCSFSPNRLNKTSHQNSFNGKNLIMRKYQKEITSKALKLLLLNNNNSQVTKKELSITKENKPNLSSSLSQEKLKKNKGNSSNTNTNSILYNSSINDSKYSSQQPIMNNPNNSKNTNFNSYFTTNNTSNKNNNTSTSSNKTPIVAVPNQNSITLNHQLTSLLNKTQSKSIGRIHNYKACSFKYNNKP